MAYSKWVNPTIAALWRYPVKSMLGERCEALDVQAHGAKGDRRYAVRDAGGKLGSGKNSRVHRRFEGLFAFQAAYQGEVPVVAFPDGRRLSGDDPGIHAALSAVFGEAVNLAEEPKGFHDAEPIHIVTTGSLERLGADERRFRANLVIETDEDETGWLGRSLQVGGVRLAVGRRTGRCVMVTMPQSELGEEPQLLRRLSVVGGDPLFGVYAEVLAPGRIRIGDQVVVS